MECFLCALEVARLTNIGFLEGLAQYRAFVEAVRSHSKYVPIDTSQQQLEEVVIDPTGPRRILKMTLRPSPVEPATSVKNI